MTRHVYAAAVVIALATSTLCACSSVSADRAPVSTPAASPSPGLSAHRLDELVAQLKSQVDCADGLSWRVDPSTYDTTRGVDCGDTSDATFVRAYEHAPTVGQVLEDWADTFGPDRGVVRSDNWFVIGPPSVVGRIEPPSGTSLVPYQRGQESKPTAAESYVTDCMRFASEATLRFVTDRSHFRRNAENYEQFFPGVLDAVARSADSLPVERIRAMHDQDRESAAASIAADRVRPACWRAQSRASESGVE